MCIRDSCNIIDNSAAKNSIKKDTLYKEKENEFVMFMLCRVNKIQPSQSNWNFPDFPPVPLHIQMAYEKFLRESSMYVIIFFIILGDIRNCFYRHWVSECCLGSYGQRQTNIRLVKG